jgi:N-acetylneuraminic acid mutarotase
MSDFTSIKAQLQKLIDDANTKTERTDADLTSAVGALIEGYGSGGSGSGGSLNIHYGDTAPEDTSKLWVKCAEPNDVVISSEIAQLPMTIDLIYSDNAITYYTKHVRVGDFVYLFNRAFGETYPILKYNLKTNELEKISVYLPNNNMGQGTFVSVGTDIYIFGGNGNGVYVFDTINETFRLLSVTVGGSPYREANAVAVGNKIYLFGGTENGYQIDSIYIFDTETETVLKSPTTLSDKINRMGCVLFGTKVYLFGGYYRNSTSNKGSSYKINIFDTETNTNRVLTVLPRGLQDIACCLVGTKVYLFGGNSGSSATASNVIYVFDIDTETITTSNVTLPLADYTKIAVLHGTDVYLLSGEQDPNNIYKLALQTDLPSGTLQIIPTIGKNEFDLFGASPKVETGVGHVLLGNSDNHAEYVEAYLHNGETWEQL